MTQKYDGQKFYACLTLAIALSFPVQIFILYAHTLSEWRQVIDKLTLLNAVTMLTLATHAVVAWCGHRSFVFFAGFTSVVVALNNSAVARFGEDYPPQLVHTGSLLFALWAFSPLLTRLLRPTRVAKRVRCEQMVALVTNDRTLAHVLAYDVSRTGMFLFAMEPSYYGLAPGDVIELHWKNSKDKPIERRAVVVRTADPKGGYPRGIGIRFDRELTAEAFH